MTANTGSPINPAHIQGPWRSVATAPEAIPTNTVKATRIGQNCWSKDGCRWGVIFWTVRRFTDVALG